MNHEAHTITETPEAVLQQAGLRKTDVRLAMIALLGSGHVLLTIDEIVQHLQRRKATSCNWATVFRNIQQFEQRGIVASVHLGDGKNRYELVSGSHHHHHVLCTHCKTLETIHDCCLQHLEQQLTRRGYTQLTHRLEFSGLCCNCSKRKPSRRKHVRSCSRFAST